MSHSLDEMLAAAEADPALAGLYEEVIRRLQAGDPADLTGLTRDRPEYAEPLRRLLPALEALVDLGASAAGPPSQAISEEPAAALAPRVLGDYRIVREIGRGGIGIVYEAEQISLGRRVALKLLPMAAAMDPRQIQRFRIEAQAAACLHHPHIVPVHGVGCERGVHYYAMQLIEGRSLAATIADLRRLDGLDPDDAPGAELAAIGTTELAARLLTGGSAGRPGESGPDSPTVSLPASASTPGAATPRAPPAGRPSSSGSSTRNREYIRNAARLALEAAEALDHAHARGILHRDIKPANLLLDDEGRLWVTDFGLAQVRGDDRLTLTGDVLGTLRYMSPEQALGRRVVVDGRTDVYSLGVTLYELLTLRPAVDGKDRAEILRRIADGEPPPLRKVNPASPADLETIVLKATAKDPTSRYATAQELAEDLRSFLADRPIRARRPGLLDRAAKWSRRHRSVVMTAVLLLVLGTVGTSIGLVRALRAERRARIAEGLAMDRLVAVTQEKERATAAKAKAKEEAAIAKAVNDFLQHDLLAKAAPDKNPRNKKVTVEELLGRAAARITGKFAEQPRIEVEIRLTIGDTYHALGDLTAAQPHLERAWEIASRVLGEEHPSALRSMNDLAALYRAQGQLDRAEPLLEKALTICRRVCGEEHPSALTCMNSLAGTYYSTGKLERSIPLFEEVLKRRRATLGSDHPNTLLTMANLGSNYRAAGRLREGIDLLELAWAKALKQPDPLVRILAWIPDTLGGAYEQAGQFARAESVYRETLETARKQHKDAPLSIELQFALARSLFKQYRYAEAESLLRECLKFREQNEADAWRTSFTKSTLGGILLGQKRYAEAEPLLVAGYEGMMRREGKIWPIQRSRLIIATEWLVQLYDEWGRKDKADDWQRKLLVTKSAGRLGLADLPDDVFTRP